MQKTQILLKIVILPGKVQKQLFTDVLSESFSEKVLKVYKKINVIELYFNNIVEL